MVAVAVAPGGAEDGAAGLPAGLEDLKIADMMLPKILILVLLLCLAFWRAACELLTSTTQDQREPQISRRRAPRCQFEAHFRKSCLLLGRP